MPKPLSWPVALVLSLFLVPQTLAQGQSYRPASGKSAEATAIDLYEDAQDEQGRGDLAAAARSLEELLERYPYSSSATKGRRQLVVLYGKMKQRLQRQQRANPLRADRRSREFLNSQPQVYGPLANEKRSDPGARRRPLPQTRYSEAFKFAVADRVFFGQEDTKLGGRAREVVRGQAKWLKTHPDLTLVLRAYADENGSDDFNRKISRRRGEAVRDLLLEHGISADRVKIVAEGRANRVATCNTPACAAQNRRVVSDVTLIRAPEVARVDRSPSAFAVPAPVPAKRNKF